MESHSFLYRRTFQPQPEKKKTEFGSGIMNFLIAVLMLAAFLWCAFMPPEQYWTFLIVSSCVLFVCYVLGPLVYWRFNVRPPFDGFTILLMALFSAEIVFLMCIAGVRIDEEAKALARQKAYEEARAVARQKAADEAADDDLSQ